MGIIGKVIKWSIVTLTILVLSHLIHWQGRSFSEHVKINLERVKRVSPATFITSEKSKLEKISAEERARLKALLND